MASKSVKDEPTWSSDTGYEKGDATRQAILLAGLREFSDAGYEAVSTRGIADTAGVKQPAINYYFGGKEKLYIACAEAVVAKYYEHTGAEALKADALLKAGAEPETIRGALVEIIGSLSALIFSAEELWYCSTFIDRELRTPGPGHELIFKKLWNPGVNLVARLIAAIKKVPPEDEASKLEAIFLLSSLLGFGSGGALSRRLMKWSEIGTMQVELINEVVGRQIALIGVVALAEPAK